MARSARVELFSSDEIAVVHVMNRTVRRCFLMGKDPYTGQNFDHRKEWVESDLRRLAAGFGIDLLCYATLSDHFHLILRSRPDVVATWDDAEVARRWMKLCPLRKNEVGQAEEPIENELDSIVNDAVKLAAIRSRLSDISWWMRLLSQNIAQRANRDDNEVGKFWQSRYRTVRLLDETAMLACAAHVDLNPIRSSVAKTLEASDYTSVQRRIQAIEPRFSSKTKNTRSAKLSKASRTKKAKPILQPESTQPDDHIAPIEINKRRDATDPRCNRSGCRASDKGFLPIPTTEYLELLNWTAQQLRKKKRVAEPDSARSILKRLGISSDVWCEIVKEFGNLFSTVAGKPEVIDALRTRNGKKRYKATQKLRELIKA